MNKEELLERKDQLENALFEMAMSDSTTSKWEREREIKRELAEIEEKLSEIDP